MHVRYGAVAVSGMLRSAVCGLRSAVVRARGWRPSSRVPSAPQSDPRSTQRPFASRRARIYFTFSHFHISFLGGPRASGIKAQMRAVGGRIARVPAQCACLFGRDATRSPVVLPSAKCQDIVTVWSPSPLLPLVPTSGVSIDRENEHDALGVAWLGGVCSARRRENTWLNRLWAGWP